MRNRRTWEKVLLSSLTFCLAVWLAALTGPKAIAAAPAAESATAKGPETAKPGYGGVLKRSYDNDAQQLGNPAARPFDLTSVKMSKPAIETLLRYDEKGFPTPWLARDYKVAKDLRSVTLSLRKGVRFHDSASCDARQ